MGPWCHVIHYACWKVRIYVVVNGIEQLPIYLVATKYKKNLKEKNYNLRYAHLVLKQLTLISPFER